LVSTTHANETFWQSAYQKHGSALLAYLRVRIPNATDAEDLLHETFVKAIGARQKPNEISKIRSYLFTIAHRLMLNQIRASHSSTHLVKAVGNNQELENQIDLDSPTPDEAMERRSFAFKLNLTLSQMNPKLRTAFDLGILQKLPYSEIAEKTGWTLPTGGCDVPESRIWIRSWKQR